MQTLTENDDEDELTFKPNRFVEAYSPMHGAVLSSSDKFAITTGALVTAFTDLEKSSKSA